MAEKLLINQLSVLIDKLIEETSKRVLPPEEQIDYGKKLQSIKEKLKALEDSLYREPVKNNEVSKEYQHILIMIKKAIVETDIVNPNSKSLNHWSIGFAQTQNVSIEKYTLIWKTDNETARKIVAKIVETKNIEGISGSINHLEYKGNAEDIMDCIILKYNLPLS